jgi:hypothetical protein
MGVTAVLADSTRAMLAQAASPPKVPAKPVAGGLVGPSVVHEPPVPKDGSKSPDDKKPGQLVPASAFQSMSEERRWVATERAIAHVLSAERNYNRALLEIKDIDALLRVTGLWKRREASALGRLEAAVNREMTTMVGPDATRDQLELVRYELVDRAEGPDAKRIVDETARQVGSYRIAAAADTAAAASRYPDLLLKEKEADFHKSAATA